MGGGGTLKIDLPVIAIRNRLPGLDPFGWTQEIHGLGQTIARTVLQVRLGQETDGTLSTDDLVYAGMTDDIAAALVPELRAEDGYLRLWLQLEKMRRAAHTLAAPDIVDAIPSQDLSGRSMAEELGPLAAVLFGESFVTLNDASEKLPRVFEQFPAGMASLCGKRLHRTALEELKAAGWSPLENQGGTEVVLVHTGHGLLVIATDDSRRMTVQKTLNNLARLGGPFLKAVSDSGRKPLRVAHKQWDGAELHWVVDGKAPRAGGGLADGLGPPAEGRIADLLRSLVGHVRAGAKGVSTPEWAQCPACGSPRVDASRLEVERGLASLQIDPDRGEFGTTGQYWLRVQQRKAGKVQVLTLVLSCPDCHEVRAFPGEDELVASSLPRRMAGAEPPREIVAFLKQQTGLVSVLPLEQVPQGVEDWAASQKFGAVSQFSDFRLTWRSAFRLPDKLVDLAQSIPTGEGENSGWKAAIGRVGRAAPTVVAWELRDLGNPNDSVRRIVVLTIDPEFGASFAERIFGPVDDWVSVTRRTCWRGRLVGTAPTVEVVLMQDFLGAPGPYGGGEADYEFLTQILRQASCVVYAGDGLLEWDDDGIQWAVDEGRLCAVIAPKAQLSLAYRPDDVAWINADKPDAEERLITAIETAADATTRAALRKLRHTIELIANLNPSEEMADHMVFGHLRNLAVHAEITGAPERWFDLLDGILNTLAVEGMGADAERKMRSSMVAKRVAEIGLPAEVSDSYWHLVEFYERTGVGKRLVNWLLPALRENPDPVLLARVRAVSERMPDLVQRYNDLNEMRGAALDGRRVDVRKAVLEFWWGAAAPAVWRGAPIDLPDLLSLAPSDIRGMATVFIGGPLLRECQRLAVLLAGVNARMEYGIPDAGASQAVIVIEPKKVDLVRLERRNHAGHLTVVVTAADVEGWRGALSGGAGIVQMTEELNAPPTPAQVIAHRMPHLAEPDLLELAGLMHAVQYEAGQTLVRRGSSVGAIGWIRSGRVVLDGRIEIRHDAMLAPEALYGRIPSTHEAVALDTVTVDLLSKSAISSLLEADRPSMVAVERAACVAMAHLVGPGTIEAPWIPRVDKPTPFTGDWGLFWPIAQRAGFDQVEHRDMERIFSSCRPVTFTEGQVLYMPGAEPPEIMLVLDGEVVIEDGRRALRVGSGRYIGRLGLVDAEWGERCRAATDVTLLMLGTRPADVWDAELRPVRRQLGVSLMERWTT